MPTLKVTTLATLLVTAILLVLGTSPVHADTAHGWEPLSPQVDNGATYNITWHPHAKIPYSTNLTPPDPTLPVKKYIRQKARFATSLSALRWAIGRIEANTGLDFVEVGYSQSATLPVTYRRHGQDPRFVSGEAEAYGGPVQFDIDENGHFWYRTATLVLDRSLLLASPRYRQRVIYLHELGHVVGLGHVDTPSGIEVMGTYAGNAYTRNLAPGDLLGLHTLYPTWRN